MPEPETVGIPRSRLFYVSIAVAVFNPIFSGLVMSWLLIRQKDMKKEGVVLAIFSLIWGVVMISLAVKYGGVPM